jgi:hypothetical protein
MRAQIVSRHARSRFERHCHLARPTVRLSDDEDYVNSAPHTRWLTGQRLPRRVEERRRSPRRRHAAREAEEASGEGGQFRRACQLRTVAECLAMGGHRTAAHATPAAATMWSVRGKRCWPALWVTLMVSGCGTSVSETYINGPPGTTIPRSPGSVRIYASGPPARPHTDVAILEVEQAHGLNEQGTALMIDRLRRRAAQLGCDGVVVGGIRERDGFPPGSGFYLLDPGATTLHGTCIVFSDETPASLPSRASPPPPSPPAPGVDRPPSDSSGCSCGAP